MAKTKKTTAKKKKNKFDPIVKKHKDGTVTTTYPSKIKVIRKKNK